MTRRSGLRPDLIADPGAVRLVVRCRGRRIAVVLDGKPPVVYIAGLQDGYEGQDFHLHDDRFWLYDRKAKRWLDDGGLVRVLPATCPHREHGTHRLSAPMLLDELDRAKHRGASVDVGRVTL